MIIKVQRTSRIAGFMFLFILVAILLNSTLFSKLIVPGDVPTTIQNVADNPFILPLGVANELILSIAGMILAIALYFILKYISRPLATAGLILKIAETILSAVIALLNFLAWKFLTLGPEIEGNSPEDLQQLAGTFLTMHDAVYSIPMIFLGPNLVIFCYLFLTSGAIPKWLAVFGILSYTLVFVYALGSIVFPELPGLILAFPSILFELLIGLWLVFKGIDTRFINELNQ